MKVNTIHSLTNQISTVDHPINQRKVVLPFPKWIYLFFYVFAAYMALPIIDVPLVGLSLSAPIFFFIAFYAIFKAPSNWFRTHRLWITLAVLIWFGTFLSATLNGLLSGGVNINTSGYLAIIRVAYWLLLFVVTIYFAGQRQVITRAAFLLGLMAFVLGAMRWLEVLLFRNFGAWSGTHWMTQNTYGFLFSTFSPFLFVFILQFKGVKRFWAGLGLLMLWSAVAVNGSRGSWVAIAVGIVAGLLILFQTRKQLFVGVLVGLTLLIGLGLLVFAGIPPVKEAVLNRFDTMDRLEEDTSYMIRQLMNQKALRLFAESPLIGIGPSRFTITSTALDIPTILRYASQSHFDSKSAHNSYLAYLAETGLAGAIPFAILLVILLIKGYPAAKQLTATGDFWPLAVFLSFIQMSVHMWAINSLYNSGTWFIYGLTGTMILCNKSLRKPGRGTP